MYLLRYSKKQPLELAEFNKFLPILLRIIIRQLKDCLREKLGMRRELFIATRYIINFDSRKIFLKYIDKLLDKRILISNGLTIYRT